MSVRFAVDRRALSLVARLVRRFPAGVLALVSGPAWANARARAVLAMLAAVLGMLALGAAPAAASTEQSPPGPPTHFFAEDFTGSGAISRPIAVAVNEQSGDIYVLDEGNDRVEVLSSSGVTLTTFNGAEAPTGAFSDPVAIAVDNSTDPLDPSAGDVYVVDAGHDVVDKFSATGVYAGQITKGAGGASLGAGLAGVAVDTEGDVWVSVTGGRGRLLNYTNAISNEFVISLEANYGIGAGDLAVNSVDNVAELDPYGSYTVSSTAGLQENERVNEIGELTYQEEGEEGETGAAVDLVNDYYYVDYAEHEEIQVFYFHGPGSLPDAVEFFGSGHVEAESKGIAVDSATGTVYVANAAAGDVAVFTRRRGEPVIEAESASLSETGAASLEAKIDPDGAETTYHFEYGLAAGKYEASVPIPAGSIAAGLSGVYVSARATGLAPGSTYHYRVVASNAPSGEVDGPDQTFTTRAAEGPASPPGCPNEQLRSEQPFASALPDCRAYELVSPANKEGVELSGEVGLAAVSGNAVAFESDFAFDKPSSSLFRSWYLSHRGSGGWTTQDISPPNRNLIEIDLTPPFSERLYTPELTKGVLTVNSSTTLSSEMLGFSDIYVADLTAGSYQLVNKIVPQEGPDEEGQPFGKNQLDPQEMGASADLSHVVFQEEDLTPGEKNTTHVFVWVEATGKDYQVDIPPAGTTFNGASVGDYSHGVEFAFEKAGLWHAVSEDGRRIVFAASNGQLYVRENPEAQQSPESGGKCTVAADACTVEVSASQRAVADPHGPQPAKPWGASANGARVFFTSKAELTENAKTGPADNAANLYEYDFEKPEGERLTDLTVDSTDTDGAQVDGVAGLSEDGAYVYFVAEGKLADNENSHGDKAEAGKPNLYVYHEGAITFIATLSPNDEYGMYTGALHGKGTRIAADGTHIAFMSERSLLGNDNTPVTPSGECGPDGCPELYLYDATTQSLACASCAPNDAPPAGHPPGYQPFGWGGFAAPRNLSEAGALFFASTEPLLPQANNGLENVYEYEDGRLYLLSDGSGASESYFTEASPSGDDVFIETTDSLLPQERANENNVYDARVDGGFPASPTPPTCDNADSCHGPESPQPGVFGAPSSATFSGPGNLAPASPPTKTVQKTAKKTTKCAAGKRRDKHGKCVKQAKKKSKKAKRARGAGENRRAK